MLFSFVFVFLRFLEERGKRQEKRQN